MPGNPLILDLVQEILESNRTPEEVCSDHPELLWEVCNQLKRAQRVEARLAELFPSSIDEPAADRKAQPLHGNDLPDIPGYKLEDVIGQGGVGVVFRARHLKLNRLIALKMLLLGAFASRHERARFIREAEAVAALSHPHIVQIFDVGEFERRPFFTMELLEGGSLAQRLAGAPQPSRQSAQLVATLAMAVAYAHELGIVHRDLKPGNILLTSNDTPKIADFGLARRVDAAQDLTITGARLGTPSYMAPEQASGKTSAVGPASDVYALGAILYEMLTGRPPFRADTAVETERQVIYEEPARPSRLNASVPRDLQTICLKCLQKDPQRRYASAPDLADDLSRYLDGKPILARPVAGFERMIKWMRRRPSSAALIASVVAMTAIVAGFGLREWSLAIGRQAQVERMIARLDEVTRLQDEERFDDARATLAGATTESVDLQRQIERAQADLKLVEQLDAIRLSRGGFVRGGGLDYAATSKEYESLFREAGIAELREPPKEVAARWNRSAIRVPLIWALDDWAACADLQHRLWILAVVRAMDPDPWRDKVRNPLIWDNVQLLSKLADEVDIDEQPVKLLVAFGTRWRRLGGNPTAFLEKVQRRYPNDFWVNF
jgi:serine/threonine-protein kinase